VLLYQVTCRLVVGCGPPCLLDWDSLLEMLLDTCPFACCWHVPACTAPCVWHPDMHTPVQRQRMYPHALPRSRGIQAACNRLCAPALHCLDLRLPRTSWCASSTAAAWSTACLLRASRRTALVRVQHTVSMSCGDAVRDAVLWRYAAAPVAGPLRSNGSCDALHPCASLWCVCLLLGTVSCPPAHI
jgi:hypothetical protein